MISKAFEVLSSDGISKYTVAFGYEDRKLTIVCSCSAGERGKMCRHKKCLMTGDATALLNPNEQPALLEVLHWVRESAVGDAWQNCRKAQSDLENSQRALKRANKTLEVLIKPRSQ